MGLRNLSIGMRGEDVRAVQATLNCQPDLPGPPLDVDGVFGPKTDVRVRAYQAEEGLAIDGIVGPKTRLGLFPYGVANVTVIGARLVDPTSNASRFAPRYPSFAPGRLTPPTLGFPDFASPPANSNPTTLTVDWSQILTDFRRSFASRYPGPLYAAAGGGRFRVRPRSFDRAGDGRTTGDLWLGGQVRQIEVTGKARDCRLAA